MAHRPEGLHEEACPEGAWSRVCLGTTIEGRIYTYVGVSLCGPSCMSNWRIARCHSWRGAVYDDSGARQLTKGQLNAINACIFQIRSLACWLWKFRIRASLFFFSFCVITQLRLKELIQDGFELVVLCKPLLGQHLQPWRSAVSGRGRRSLRVDLGIGISVGKWCGLFPVHDMHQDRYGKWLVMVRPFFVNPFGNVMVTVVHMQRFHRPARSRPVHFAVCRHICLLPAVVLAKRMRRGRYSVLLFRGVCGSGQLAFVVVALATGFAW